MLCSLLTLQFSKNQGLLLEFSKTSERLRYFPNKYSYEADVSPLEVVHVSTTELAYKVEQRSI